MADFQGSRVTPDGGLIPVRKFDERLSFSELIEQHLTDSWGRTHELAAAVGEDRRTTGPALRDSRYYWTLLAEGHLTRERFDSMLRMIAALPLPDG